MCPRISRNAMSFLNRLARKKRVGMAGMPIFTASYLIHYLKEVFFYFFIHQLYFLGSYFLL